MAPATGWFFLTGAPLNFYVQIPLHSLTLKILSHSTWDLVLKKIEGGSGQKKPPCVFPCIFIPLSIVELCISSENNWWKEGHSACSLMTADTRNSGQNCIGSCT